MLPSTSVRTGRDVEVVAAQEVGQAVVDFGEAPVEDAEVFFLVDDSVAELLEASDEDRNGARVWAFAKRFFPFVFVFAGVGAVESGAVFVDGVVEVGLEGFGLREWIPFLINELNLLGDGSLACGGDEVSGDILEGHIERSRCLRGARSCSVHILFCCCCDCARRLPIC